MTFPKPANTDSISKNIFGLIISRPFWQQNDFWLACIAAILLWLIFKPLNLPLPMPVNIGFSPLSSLFFLFILVFPVLEEIVFRGLIQESLHKLLNSEAKPCLIISHISGANLLTSIFFAISHLWAHSLTWALATLVPSLIFGYFKDQYQSLKPSICLHIFYNVVFYLFLYHWSLTQ